MLKLFILNLLIFASCLNAIASELEHTRTNEHEQIFYNLSDQQELGRRCRYTIHFNKSSNSHIFTLTEMRSTGNGMRVTNQLSFTRDNQTATTEPGPIGLEMINFNRESLKIKSIISISEQYELENNSKKMNVQKITIKNESNSALLPMKELQCIIYN